MLPDALLMRQVRVDGGKSRKRNRTSFEQGKKTSGKVKGHLSRASAAKLKRAIQLLIASSTPKKAKNFKTGDMFTWNVNFLTFTLPIAYDQMDDYQFKRQALNRLIIALKRRFKMNNYVWRAEPQENGNIHIHLLADVYMHYQPLRNIWNDILRDLGFISRYQAAQQEFYKDGFRLKENHVEQWSPGKQYQAWKKGVKNGWNDPNSTDVHSLYKIENVAGYVCKYMSKSDDERREIGGRLWGCSDGLKVKQVIEFHAYEEEFHQMEKAFEDFPDRVYRTDYYAHVRIPSRKFRFYVRNRAAQEYDDWLALVRGNAPPPDTPGTELPPEADTSAVGVLPGWAG